MPAEQDKFKELFRKYRLRAEFSTLSELGNALAEKGLACIAFGVLGFYFKPDKHP